MGVVKEREQLSIISYDSLISKDIASETTADSEFTVTLQASRGRKMLIRYLRLSTSPEVEGNIILKTSLAASLKLLETNQPPSTDQTFDLDTVCKEGILCKSLSLYCKTTILITALRTVKLYYRGILLKEAD